MTGQRRSLRILYVTNGFPFPLTSGLLRHYHLIRRLARSHSIILFSLVDREHTAEHREALAPFVDRIETFRTAARTGSPLVRARLRLASLVGLGDPAARRLRDAVDVAARNGEGEVILLSGKRTYPALAAARRLPAVVDMCDATSLRLAGQRRVASPARAALLALDEFTVRRVERGLVRSGLRATFASARDRDAVVGPGAAGLVSILPNGVDATYWRRESRSLGTDEIIFTGAMDYPPNEDAALFLATEILPLVRQAIPEARLRIVGRDPTVRLRAVSDPPRVVVTGPVDDMRPHLEQASVFACPLRFGSGIQNKVLEAMAMELPVVTSSVAAAGLRLPDADEPPLTVADEPADFAAALVDQLRQVRTDPRPNERVREYVLRNFDWDEIAARLDRLLLDAAGNAGQ